MYDFAINVYIQKLDNYINAVSKFASKSEKQHNEKNDGCQNFTAHFINHKKKKKTKKTKKKKKLSTDSLHNKINNVRC